MDPRIVKLADLLVDYSCRVQAGDKVLIDYEGDCCKELVRQLIKKVYAKGGLPYVDIRDSAVTRELLLSCSEEQITFMNECSLQKMKGMQAYIAIRAGGNTAELSDVPSDKLNMYYRLTSPTLDYRVNETKWVVLRYPNNSMAQLANTSLEAFEDFYFDVCTLDYSKMDRAMDALAALMERTDKVHIKGPGTNPDLLHQRYPGYQMCRRMQYPGRRSLHRPGQRLYERYHLIQYTVRRTGLHL